MMAGARWLVNLRPELGHADTEPRMVLLEPAAHGMEQLVDPGEVLEYARLRWPGEVLDVVGPDGCSYLLCSIPPWYLGSPTPDS